MAWSLSNEERAKVRQTFLEMDQNKQGTVSIAELKQIVEDNYDIADDEARNIFEQLQANSDEPIHYSGFLAAMVSTKLDMHDDLLRAAFDRFDTDGTGYISADNLYSVLGEALDLKELSILMEEVDQVDDARISYQKFVSYLRGDPLDHHVSAAESIVDRELKNLNRVGKRPTLVKRESNRPLPPDEVKHDPKHEAKCCTIL